MCCKRSHPDVARDVLRRQDNLVVPAFHHGFHVRIVKVVVHLGQRQFPRGTHGVFQGGHTRRGDAFKESLEFCFVTQVHPRGERHGRVNGVDFLQRAERRAFRARLVVKARPVAWSQVDMGVGVRRIDSLLVNVVVSEGAVRAV